MWMSMVMIIWFMLKGVCSDGLSGFGHGHDGVFSMNYDCARVLAISYDS